MKTKMTQEEVSLLHTRELRAIEDNPKSYSKQERKWATEELNARLGIGEMDMKHRNRG